MMWVYQRITCLLFSTSGAGSCFYYTLSRLVYGNEDHVIEMRVRVLKEGFQEYRSLFGP